MASRSSSGAAASDPADRLVQTHQQLTEAVEALVSGGQWATMLATAAKFSRYSPSNVLLIMLQKPDATKVAGLRTWNSLGRRVNKGEKSIAILAPCTYPAREKTAAGNENVASETGPATPSGSDDERVGPDRGAKQLRGFRVVSVFDISQTNGAPLPEAPRSAELSGAVPAGAWDALARVVAGEAYALERGDCGQAGGYTHYGQRVVRVRDDVDDAHALVVLAHELGHIRADHETRFGGLYATSRDCRGLAEVEAQSIAHLIAASLGVAADAMSVPYVAGWAAGDTNLLRATATRVITTARAVLADAELLPVGDVVAVAHPDPAPRPSPAARWQPAAAARVTVPFAGATSPAVTR